MAANRIHVKDGSIFVDAGLVVHPRELHPKNEAALRAKLNLTYDMNTPSFFEDKSRQDIALRMGELAPVLPQTRQKKLLNDIDRFNQDIANGVDDKTAQGVADREAPMRALVRSMNASDGHDPIGFETLQNGLAMYLLTREALSRRGYLEKLSDYATKHDSAEQVFGALSDKIGVSAREMRETAQQGGVAAVGQRLGLEPAFISEVAQLVGQMSRNDFSMHMLEHWHMGRAHVPANAPIDEKISAGKAAHIDNTITELRQKAKGVYEVPPAIQKEERRIADALSRVTPVERALMFALGYEICHTPETKADSIAFHKSVYGLHRKTANDLRDARGTYRVYFAGKGNEKDSLRTMRHEIAHNLWPNAFAEDEVQLTDELVQFDRKHLNGLKELTTTHKPFLESAISAYQAASNPQECMRLQQLVNTQTERMGIRLGDILPLLNGADQLTWMVSEAHDRLKIDGPFYDKSGYHDPSTRLREMISRYAELRDIEYHEQPRMQALLGFVSPGMSKIFDEIYLPHLERVYAQVMDGQEKPGVAAGEELRSARGGVQDSARPTTSGLSDIEINERVKPALETLSKMGVGA